ncbi:MAG: hypothetical protein H6712_29065 [Myxococcales bacterium]|nr:hypothetical protein [Myxococcales bacterium]MCB9717935.1 hypothetical protein [Myxococcales bacterium]
MNARRLPTLLLPALLAMAAPGCIIVSDDGDDSAGDAGSGDAGSSDGSGGADGMDEDTGAEGGGTADEPTPGLWIYAETGQSTNECEFLDDPSNGWGEYGVELVDGGFRVTPGDDTEPFDCSSGGGSFECPQRLQEEVMAGGTTLQVLVTIEGTLPMADAMAGTQLGEVVCEGSDCALAEQLLGTTLPCSFSVGFTGERAGS